EASRAWRRAAAVSRRARGDRRDRLFRTARRSERPGRRRRFRLGCGGSSGRGRRAGRQGEGMTVIGSAGGPEKCDLVRSLGADQVIDYKAGSILKSLAAAAPDGIDVYFDNVGGDHLDAAFALARDHARFAICGMIQGYNDPTPASFRFIARVIAARIRLKGFIVFDYFPRMAEFYRDMGQWVASGAVKAEETVVDGLEAMPDAFRGLFSGQNVGKMLVRL